MIFFSFFMHDYYSFCYFCIRFDRSGDSDLSYYTVMRFTISPIAVVFSKIRRYTTQIIVDHKKRLCPIGTQPLFCYFFFLGLRMAQPTSNLADGQVIVEAEVDGGQRF